MSTGDRVDIERFVHLNVLDMFGSTTREIAEFLAGLDTDLLAMEVTIGDASGPYKTAFTKSDIDLIQAAGIEAFGYMSIGSIDSLRGRFGFFPDDIVIGPVDTDADTNEVFLKYWDERAVDQYKLWIQSLMDSDLLDMDGAFMDVVGSYQFPQVVQAIQEDFGIADPQEAYIRGTIEMMELLIELDAHGKSLDEDFKLYTNGGFLFSNHHYPADLYAENDEPETGINDSPRLDLIDEVAERVDAVLFENFMFPSGENLKEDMRILGNIKAIQPGGKISYSPETARLIIGFLENEEKGVADDDQLLVSRPLNTPAEQTSYFSDAEDNGFIAYIAPFGFNEVGLTRPPMMGSSPRENAGGDEVFRFFNPETQASPPISL